MQWLQTPERGQWAEQGLQEFTQSSGWPLLIAWKMIVPNSAVPPGWRLWCSGRTLVGLTHLQGEFIWAESSQTWVLVADCSLSVVGCADTPQRWLGIRAVQGSGSLFLTLFSSWAITMLVDCENLSMRFSLSMKKKAESFSKQRFWKIKFDENSAKQWTLQKTPKPPKN